MLDVEIDKYLGTWAPTCHKEKETDQQTHRLQITSYITHIVSVSKKGLSLIVLDYSL